MAMDGNRIVEDTFDIIINFDKFIILIKIINYTGTELVITDDVK